MKRIIGVMIAVLIAGCSTTPRVTTEIDALSASYDTSSDVVYIMPDKDISDGLQFEEFKRYVEHAFKRTNMSLAKDITEADTVVYLSYAAESGQRHQYTYSQPVYGDTGIESSRTVKEKVKDEDGNTVVREKTVYDRGYGIIGHTTHIGSYTTWPMRLRLRAIKDDKEVWVVVAVSNDTTNDLRQVFPAMLYLATPYIGNSTGQKIERVIKLDDPQLQSFKQGL